MAFELKEGQGSLFRNRRKTKPMHPDYEGELRIGGKLHRIGGWLRESQKSGTKWMSLNVKPDEGASAQELPLQQDSQQATSRDSPELNDPIPF